MRRSHLNSLAALLITFALSLVAFTGTAFAEEKPMDYIKNRVKLVDTILAGPMGERDAKLRALFNESVDFDDLAERSLGKHWPKLSEEQRTLYKKTFRELLELTYTKRLSKKNPESDYTIEWDGEKVRKDTGTVTAFVLYEETETEMEFTLKKHPEKGWIIYDAMIDGASVERTYQKNYGKIIDKEGFDSLIKKMNDKIAELNKE